jgi:EAL domain-containing protein (putative c-di-GMP-specific phosphodiesterase class I)
MQLPPRIAATTQEFHEKLESGGFQVVFQPLMDLAQGSILGYEVLGRGSLAGLAVGPIELFMLALEHGKARALSTAFRNMGCEQAKRLPGKPMIFFNTHPQELEDPKELLRSLSSLDREPGAGRLVLEIHESSVTDIPGLMNLREDLRQMDIGLAFDDFGTGQPRLLELAEVDADYLKFDIQMIKDLDQASTRRRDMVASLVSLVRSFDLVPVAEGIETSGEATACRDVGFPMGQGFYFARPAPASSF